MMKATNIEYLFLPNTVLSVLYILSYLIPIKSCEIMIIIILILQLKILLVMDRARAVYELTCYICFLLNMSILTGQCPALPVVEYS